MSLLLSVGTGAVLVLVSAKAHGREVRLVRERAGIRSVQFGGDNPPFVEALWRSDRARFWGVFAIAAPLLGAWAWVVGGWHLALLAVLAWAPSAAFAAAGLSRVETWGPASAGWWGLVVSAWAASLAAGLS